MGYDCSIEMLTVLAIAERSKEYLEPYERKAIELVKSLYGVEGDEVSKSICPQPVSYEKKDRLVTLSCKCGERAGLTTDIWQPNMTCIKCGYAVHKEIVKD